MKYFLYPTSLLFGILAFIKNFLYDIKLLKAQKLPCSVISVGNITSGGTGKTPTVLYLCKILQQGGRENIGIISRGYGRGTKGMFLVSKGDGPLASWESSGDEPFMMAKKTRNIPIVVDNDRYRGGEFLHRHFNTEIIILDDGFQHRSLYRNLNIVLINGDSSPSDYQFLPFGFLREPWSSLKRADTVIFTKSKPRQFLLNKIKKADVPYFHSYMKSFISFHSLSREKQLKNLTGEKVVLLSGIGDPKSLEKLIRDYNCVIEGHEVFRDHYSYKKSDIFKIINFSKKKNVGYIITTEKDWVKIEPLKPNFHFIVVKIEIDLIEKNSINKLLKNYLVKN